MHRSKCDLYGPPRFDRQAEKYARRSVTYNVSADKVLQSEILPELKPFKNQRFRCAEVPWVKASGTT
jgi:hypothetical protein